MKNELNCGMRSALKFMFSQLPRLGNKFDFQQTWQGGNHNQLHDPRSQNKDKLVVQRSSTISGTEPGEIVPADATKGDSTKGEWCHEPQLQLPSRNNRYNKEL